MCVQECAFYFLGGRGRVHRSSLCLSSAFHWTDLNAAACDWCSLHTPRRPPCWLIMPWLLLLQLLVGMAKDTRWKKITEVCRFTHVYLRRLNHHVFLFFPFHYLLCISSILFLVFMPFLISNSYYVLFSQKPSPCTVRLGLSTVGYDSNSFKVHKIRSEKVFFFFFLTTLPALKMEQRICLHHRLSALQYLCCREKRTLPCWRWEVGVTGMLLLHVVATGTTKRLDNSCSPFILLHPPPFTPILHCWKVDRSLCRSESKESIFMTMLDFIVQCNISITELACWMQKLKNL